MIDMKDCFQHLGLSDVGSVLQTGNIIFSSSSNSSSLKRLIEEGITKQFNYPAKVQLCDFPRLLQVIEACPYEDNKLYHSYVVFIENRLEKELAHKAVGLDSSTEAIQAGDGVIYWRVLKGSTLKSQFAKCLLIPQYKTSCTSRNINTLRKLALLT